MSFCGLIFVFIFEQAVLWPVLFYVFFCGVVVFLLVVWCVQLSF